MSQQRLPSLVGAAALVGGCGQADRDPPARPAIEARDAAGAVTARVLPGNPCRATVGSAEFIVGGHPLTAQYGDERWTAETAANGTTLLKNGAPAARIHADQLFDREGLPIIRVLDDGAVANRSGAIVRRAARSASGVAIGGATVTGTANLVLAAVLTAPEVSPELRAITACHLLFGAY